MNQPNGHPGYGFKLRGPKGNRTNSRSCDGSSNSGRLDGPGSDAVNERGLAANGLCPEFDGPTLRRSLGRPPGDRGSAAQSRTSQPNGCIGWFGLCGSS
jgi:hypothetical protein